LTYGNILRHFHETLRKREVLLLDNDSATCGISRDHLSKLSFYFEADQAEFMLCISIIFYV